MYKSKKEVITGTSYSEVSKKARRYYNQIRSSTKRRPYVRSKFFNGQKVFLSSYWEHLHKKKNHRDKTRRLKYFLCGIELIRFSGDQPEIKINPNNNNEILYRFFGETRSGKKFVVQVKEDKHTREKWLLSTFPYK